MANNDVIGKLSPGPYQWGIFREDSDPVEYFKKNLSFGSGPVHTVLLPNHPQTVIGSDPDRPEHAVTLCIVGNGPNSEDNAKALVCLLSQRDLALENVKTLPIPTTPDAVAWAEWAIFLEETLGITRPN